MEADQWTPADLLQLAGGYWGTGTLHAGVEIDIFTPLSSGEMTAVKLAAEKQCDVRGMTMLLNATAALGLIVREAGRYRLTPFSREFLVRTSDSCLGHIILHHHQLVPGWTRLHEAVKSGAPVRERVSHGDDEKARENFEMGMFNLAMLMAPKIVPTLDLTGRRRLLDLGGGPGTYAIHFCLHNPGLEAIVVDLETTRPFAEKSIARFGLTERIRFMAGDFAVGGFPAGCDVAWLSHVLHGEGPAQATDLLVKAVAALEPGGMLAVQEFILDDSKDGPLFPALFSLNMLVGTPAGQSYSGSEISAMMAEAGLVELRRLPIELPNGSGIMTGLKRLS